MSDLTASQQAAFDRLYGDNPQPEQESSKPGVFTGWYKAAAGIPGGASGAVLSTASSATDEQVNPDGGLFSPKDILNPIIHPTIEQARQSAADYYRPDPATTGWVGNTLYGVGDVLTRATIGNVLAPGTGLPLAAGTTGFERAKDLKAQGIDENTAALSGGINAAALLASGGLSSVGTSTAARVLSGAGLNIAFGSGARALDSSVLRANGYEAQAAQQEWNDSSAIIADGIIGAAFHLLPHAESVPKPTPDEIDAALTAKNNQNLTDAAPGVPVDPTSAGAHVDAMDLAHDQFTDGQPVDVAPVVRDATFIDRPAEEGTPVTGDAIEEALRNDGVTEDEINPPKSNAQITEDLQAKLADHPAAVAEYSQNPDSAGGTILNTDIARELSPDYLADRTRSAPVHEPASQFIKRLYAEKLAAPTPEGLDRTVLFTAGGTGAGKTTALKKMSGAVRPEIVYDTNMNTLASAEKKVKQALDAGRDVRILYVYRDPVDALIHGAVSRANRQVQEHGTGRTVPLGEHARTHLGVRGVMEALAEKYRNDPRVDIHAFDNSRGKDLGRFSALEDIPRVEENGLHERLKAALDEEYRAGGISDATYAGFNERGRSVLGEGRLSDEAGLQRGAVQGTGGQPQPERDGGARGGPSSAAPRSASEQNAGRMAPGAGERAPESRHGAPGQEVAAADVPDAQTSAGTNSKNGRAGQARPREALPDASAEQRAGLDSARAADVDRARSIVQAYPEAVLDDGTTAAEALRAADDDVQQAQKTGEAIQAAVACFLRFGSDL